MLTALSPSKLTRKASHPSGTSLRGFSLVEILCVIAVISVMTAFVMPALTESDASNVSNASYTISGALQRARTYAMAHNTYVWVGFYEEAANASAPTSVVPPYAGAGRVVIGMVASVDGTQINADGTSAPLNASRIVQIDRLTRVQNVHLTDLGAPTNGATPLSSRPPGAYEVASATPPGYTISSTQQPQCGISSDSSEQTTSPFSVGAYTFYKTVRFSPTGEASIDGSTIYQRVGEVDLRPTHGAAINVTSPNVVAIQFSGIGGGLQTYRN
jgi:prepilin-type N-terminal cleavage/methylation domain-containing protein